MRNITFSCVVCVLMMSLVSGFLPLPPIVPRAFAEEPASTEVAAPTEQPAPADEPAPVDDPAPVEESIPGGQVASGDEAAPVQEAAPADEAPPAPEPAEEPSESSKEMPVREEIEAGVIAAFASAKPLPIGTSTEIVLPASGEAWFKVAVESDLPKVLRVGGQNLWKKEIRVYDAKGAPFSVLGTRQGRESAWHGLVEPGTYFVQVRRPVTETETDHQRQLEEVAAKIGGTAMASDTTLGKPALLAMVDAIGPGTTPRKAAQLGLNYIEVDVPAWQNRNPCNGCHMQSQALMGMAVAKKRGYRVQERPAAVLGEFLGIDPGEDPVARLYAALGIRHYVEGYAPQRKELLLTSAKSLIEQEQMDRPFDSNEHPPVQAGVLTGAAMALDALYTARKLASPEQCPEITKTTALAKTALDKSKPKTVQDHVLRIIARTEADESIASSDADVTAVLAMQNKDGGFGEAAGGGHSNAYGTGQALYGMRLSGIPPEDPRFKRAVEWLVDHQLWSGTWPLANTACSSDIAHAMWAVIGLAGSIDAKPARVAVKFEGETQSKAPPSLEMILDASGSMKRKIGGRPMMEIAKTALIEVLKEVPENMRVGLRVYGHSIKEGKPGAKQNSELVFPFAAGDRAALQAKIASIQALGTTPIAYSLSEAGKDLAKCEGDKLLVLMTDGKEECGGDPVKAVSELVKQGIKVRLNIVIFALKDKAATDLLRKAASLTGGKVFEAKDARQLRAAFQSSMSSAFDLVDASEKTIASGGIGRAPVESEAGTFTVVLKEGNAPVRIPGVVTASGKITRVYLEEKDGRLTHRIEAPAVDEEP